MIRYMIHESISFHKPRKMFQSLPRLPWNLLGHRSQDGATHTKSNAKYIVMLIWQVCKWASCMCGYVYLCLRMLVVWQWIHWDSIVFWSGGRMLLLFSGIHYQSNELKWISRMCRVQAIKIDIENSSDEWEKRELEIHPRICCQNTLQHIKNIYTCMDTQTHIYLFFFFFFRSS